ncbi:hypothetical protein GQ43DRAFT_246403 [Delitschia confertaspora ATCC 74209]|uniref:TM7S3/TM198-like domain-containing protein n=1 Tax=Delitschia confertaspora ATCC 74209 TaxID=1513339 RepID=A0A9P4JQH2_9PLEO|nr:hypothetical protein GQ43DRAFT_246403 [Delitschia confertaspora ATCC 74209]
MRSLIYILALLLFFNAGYALRYPIVLRQDDPPPSDASQTPEPTKAAGSQASLSSSPSLHPSSLDTASSKPTDHTLKTSTYLSTALSVTIPSSGVANAAATSISIEPTPSAVNGKTSHYPLPIQPKLSPAMGIAGFILLVSGSVYTVIGIRNKWLYVFFSSAYLASLAVTVLIIYLMNPPISQAVQGAFFVAAVVSGLIFGGLSLVFPDITDGMGCLLGGFCLSMWFLTLKSGGLITSTTGRGIFIGTMCLASFSLSFSHHTRTYGLIVGISFAGATATVVGIDCFSRAGWKEFWVYLWHLNEDEFPLNTTSYPITRGIKVESACVIIIFVVGLISQLKLWKLIKDRRQKNVANHEQQDRSPKQAEDDIGRKIEEKVIRERAQWEAAYGDKTADHTDSAVGSSRNSHMKASAESIEMDDMQDIGAEKVSEGAARPTVPVTVLERNGTQHIDPQSNLPEPSKRSSARMSGVSTEESYNARTSARITTIGSDALGASNRSSFRSSNPPSALTPTTLMTAVLEGTGPQQRGSSSTSGVLGSVPPPLSKIVLPSEITKTSPKHDFALSRTLQNNSESAEALLIPEIRDDASSVAATLNDEHDIEGLPELSPSQSPVQREAVSHMALAQTGSDVGPRGDKSQQLDSKTVQGKPSARAVGNASFDERPKDLTILIPQQPLTSPAPSRSAVSQAGKSPTRLSLTVTTDSSSDGAQPKSPVEEFKAALPDSLPKVALSYRTNEWAKHLEQAEKPEFDELAEPDSPGVQVNHQMSEALAPVHEDVVKLVRPEANRNSTQSSIGKNPYRNSNLGRSASNLARQSQAHLYPTPLSRSPSTILASSTVPPTTLTGVYPKAVRNSSPPYISRTLAESPIDEGFITSRSTPSPVAGSTLLEKRETIIQSRAGSHSLSPYGSAQDLASIKPIARSSSRVMDTDGIHINDKVQLTDLESMTLAQRKRMIQSSRQPSTSQKRRVSNQSLADQTQGFDSHQPKRQSSLGQEQREARLANWRESIRQDIPARSATTDDGNRREKKINDLREKETVKQQHAKISAYRESIMDKRMRSSEMLEAHREAMHRLQANSRKNL